MKVLYRQQITTSKNANYLVKTSTWLSWIPKIHPETPNKEDLLKPAVLQNTTEHFAEARLNQKYYHVARAKPSESTPLYPKQNVKLRKAHRNWIPAKVDSEEKHLGPTA